MKNKDVALEALEDFLDRAWVKINMPNEVIRLASTLAEMIRENDRELLYEFWLQNGLEIHDFWSSSVYMDLDGYPEFREYLGEIVEWQQEIWMQS